MDFSVLQILGIVVIALLFALAGILAYAASKPNEFRIERSRDIKASPERIFALINDLRSWGAWSPYEKRDPEMHRTYSGADSGKGAVYQWDGDKNVGAGRMEIVDITPPSRIIIKLDFIRPMEGHNTAEFSLAPRGNMTRVTWAMFGPAPFMSKLMQVFISFDKMIGKDFEQGLDNLKALAEG
jgi:uncharacterized protein YndB with AHSA1/START domain